MSDVFARAQVPQHLSGGEEVIGGAGGDGEDGVAQPWGVGAVAEDGFFLDVGGGHDVEGEGDGALAVGRVEGVVGVVVWGWGEGEEGETS